MILTYGVQKVFRPAEFPYKGILKSRRISYERNRPFTVQLIIVTYSYTKHFLPHLACLHSQYSTKTAILQPIGKGSPVLLREPLQYAQAYAAVQTGYALLF